MTYTPPKLKLEWEIVPANEHCPHSKIEHEIVTWRARVPNGWLVSVWGSRSGADAESGSAIPGGSNWGGGLTYVPDPDGVWE